MNYNEYYAKALLNLKVSEGAVTIEWYNKPEIILSEDDNGYPLWYQDGELNVCYLALTNTYKMAMAIKWRLFMIHQ
jgi:propionyl-CoA synthetase